MGGQPGDPPAPPAEAFTVGLVFVKPLEMNAITAMLDERFGPVQLAHGDYNDYTLERIGDHHVVIVGPARGDQGTVVTAQFAGTIRLTFPNITVSLLVGIGGAIPRYPDHDVRLGDAVVGAPEDGPAVVQYDLGKRTEQGFEQRRVMARPPGLLLKVVNKVEDRSLYMEDGAEDMLKPHLDRFARYPRLRREYQRPSCPDRLFQSTFSHEPGSECSTHDAQFEQVRSLRESDHVAIHYGTILSGDTLMKSALDRDQLGLQHPGALCIEMEAAGLMDVFPCLVVRGVSDYADSHKNNAWQKYAAATAAAYARELLLNTPVQAPRLTPSDGKGANRDDGQVVFSGANYGVQVAQNTGSMTNHFGRG